MEEEWISLFSPGSFNIYISKECLQVIDLSEDLMMLLQ